MQAEKSAEILATWHFYSEIPLKSIRGWLFDPSYNIAALSYRDLLKHLKQEGHLIGLHPGFDSWKSTQQLSAARQRLEEATLNSVNVCRQHWLRFSWRHTWHSQADAGLNFDTTLMFNDRPGFRASSALIWKPWSESKHHSHSISILPTVLMDSHSL